MTVVPLPKTGNSSKFQVTVAKRGEFTLAMSFTLRSAIWKIQPDDELETAKQLAEAIVSRHDPKLPFKKIYILAEHNAESTLEGMIKFLRRVEI